jgi:hypothetical protein
MPPDWTVYYDDGSTYTSQGQVEDTPGLGVLVVAQRVDGRWSIVQGHDFYWWDTAEQRWWGADQAGVWDHLHRPGWSKVVFGRTVGNHRFTDTMARAMRDHGMIGG